MVSRYFKIQELVDKNTYSHRGDNAWLLFDSRAITMLDRLKEVFSEGTITVNNWYWGGDREWSGLRTSESPYYSPTSQHTFGRAFDCVFSAYSAEQVRTYLLRHQSEFKYITRLEEGVSWLHFDVANTDTNGIITFKG